MIENNDREPHRDPQYTVTVRDLVAYIERLQGTGMAFRIDRPATWAPSIPTKPTIMIAGLGEVSVRGGSQQFLVVHTELSALRGADQDAAIQSPDFRRVNMPRELPDAMIEAVLEKATPSKRKRVVKE